MWELSRLKIYRYYNFIYGLVLKSNSSVRRKERGQCRLYLQKGLLGDRSHSLPISPTLGPCPLKHPQSSIRVAHILIEG